MNLKELVQEFCRRTGLGVPSFVVSNSDARVSQFLGLLNECVDDLVTRRIWQRATREATWASLATESQGTIASLADGGFEGIVPDTFFDRSQNLPVRFFESPEAWQASKALAGIGPYYRARLRQNQLLIQPVPAAGHTMAFEYYSSWLILSEDGTTYRPYWAFDTDTLIFPDRIPLAWLRWRWKAEKGLDYAEEKEAYEAALAMQGLRDGNAPAIQMDNCPRGRFPGIVVPEGNWNQ